MTTRSSSAANGAGDSPCARSAKRVGFEGAECIEYDAELPAVVRLGGVGRPMSTNVNSSLDHHSWELECQARGLALPDDPKAAQHALQTQYTAELQQRLRVLGFAPASERLDELRTQHRVAELLLTWADGAKGEAPGEPTYEESSTAASVERMLDPQTLRRALLAKKELAGLVDDGYAFGRRFLSVTAYLDTLDEEEVLALARAHAVPIPTLDEAQRAAVKAADRELLAAHGTGQGRPLKLLTLRQLVVEAQARGLAVGDGPNGARDSKGKKSKRAWVDALRPLLRAETRALKIREQEETLLREELARVLERDLLQAQHARVAGLVQNLLGNPPSSQETSGGSDRIGDDSVEPQDADKTREYLARMLKPVAASIIDSEPDAEMTGGEVEPVEAGQE